MELTENISSEDSQLETKNYKSKRMKRRKKTSDSFTDEEYDAKKSKKIDQQCNTDNESDNDIVEDDDYQDQNTDDKEKKSAKVENETKNKKTDKSTKEGEVYYDKGLPITDSFLVQIMKNRRKRRAGDSKREKDITIDSIDDEVESHISIDIDEQVKSAIAQKNSKTDGSSSKETESESERNGPILKCPRYRTDLLKGKTFPKLCTDEFMDNYFFSLSLKYCKQKLLRVKIPVIDIEESSSSSIMNTRDKKDGENEDFNEGNEIKTIKTNEIVATPPKKRKLNYRNIDESRESNSDEDIRPKTRSQKRANKIHTCPICMKEMECDFEYFEYHASECKIY